MIAALMEFNNFLLKAKETPVVQSKAWPEAIHALILMLAPIAPHLAEELWERIGQPYSVHQQLWPKWDEAAAADEVITLVVQVNGKLRDHLSVPVGVGEDKARAMALASPKVQRSIANQSIVKVIYVPDKLLNIVVR
jgi:leucyl-tRNA synthetase